MNCLTYLCVECIIKMKVVAGFIKSCSDITQDYYQEGYDDITNLLIKFLRKEGTTMKEIRVKAGFEEVYDKLKSMKADLEEEVRRTVAEKSADIDNMMASCTYEVEVEDKEEDAVEENPSQEEQVNVVE